MPGSSPTMERRLLVTRLKRVDLPTFGRPQMAKSGAAASWAMDTADFLDREEVNLAHQFWLQIAPVEVTTLFYYRESPPARLIFKPAGVF